MSGKQYSRRVTKKSSRNQQDIKDEFKPSRKVRELPRKVGAKSKLDERRSARRVTRKPKRESSPRERGGQSRSLRAVSPGRKPQLRASPRIRTTIDWSIERSRSRSIGRRRREVDSKLWLERKPRFRDPSRERFVAKDKVTLRRRRSRSRYRSKSRDNSRYLRVNDRAAESFRSLGGRVNSNNKCDSTRDGGQRGRRLERSSQRRKTIQSQSSRPKIHPQRRKLVQKQYGNKPRPKVRRNSLPKPTRRNLSPKPGKRRTVSPKSTRGRDLPLKSTRRRDLSPKPVRRKDYSPLPTKRRDQSPPPQIHSSRRNNELPKPHVHPSRRKLVDCDRPRVDKQISIKEESRKKSNYGVVQRRESWKDRSVKRALRSRDRDNDRSSSSHRHRSVESKDSPQVFPPARRSRDSSRLSEKSREKSCSQESRSSSRSRSRSRSSRRSLSRSVSLGRRKNSSRVSASSEHRKSNNLSKETSDDGKGKSSERSKSDGLRLKTRSRSLHSKRSTESAEKVIHAAPKVETKAKPVKKRGSVKIKRERVELDDLREHSPRKRKAYGNLPLSRSRHRSRSQRHRSRSLKHRSRSQRHRSRSLKHRSPQRHSSRSLKHRSRSQRDKSSSYSRSSRSRSRSRRSKSWSSHSRRSNSSKTRSKSGSRQRSPGSHPRSERAPSPKISPEEQKAQYLSLLNTHLTKPCRRIYIGNLPVAVGLNGAKIVDFLTQACDIMGIKTSDPIVSCWMSTDKTFCFVEFRGVRDAEESKRLLAENHIKFGERLLRFGWPKDWTPPPPHLVDYVVGGKDPPLPETISLSTIEDVYRQYPKLFRHNEVLLGQQAASVLLCGEDITLVKQEIAEPRTMATTMNGEITQTRVLLLDRMISKADITKEDTYGQIFGDIKTECKKYGHVRRLLIPRPGYVKGDYGVGKVYVQFEHIESAIIAKEALSKRRFDKREIIAAFYDETKFIKNIF